MNSMLSHFRITHQLSITVFLLLAGFGIITYVYLTIIDLEKNSIKDIQRLENYKLLIDDVHIRLLQASRIEKSFLLKKDKKFIKEFKENFADLLNEVDVIEAAAPLEIGSQEIAKLADNVKTYGRTFLESADRYEKVGLMRDAQSSKITTLNKKAQLLAGYLNDARNAKLTATFNRIRDNERGFISEVDIDKFKSWLTLVAQFNVLTREIPNPGIRERVEQLSREYQSLANTVAKDIYELVKLIDKYQKASETAQPLFGSLLTQSKNLLERIQNEGQMGRSQNSRVFITVLALIALVISGLLFLFWQRLGSSINRLNSTVHDIDSGYYEARTRMQGADELSIFGRLLDRMLDERMEAHLETQKENEELNLAVINLLESASKLSENDLTVTLRVTEDITGPVADAINQMVDETVNVLKNIKNLASKVRTAAITVNNQGGKVSQVAKEEQKVVLQTISRVNRAAESVTDVSRISTDCNIIAGRAREICQRAFDAVMSSANSMSDISKTISETEKRIKRLGERSQEITAIVDIINAISERTHVLALNASMQAAAAGEAGRGFAVVADEVQRLAESSRNSTAQITALIRNMQTETSDTITVMNKTIDKVAMGAELAQNAGRQMIDTQKTTDSLAESVNMIAQRMAQQLELSDQIRKDAMEIQSGSKQTFSELEEQSAHTRNLVLFSKTLVQSVDTFKLPQVERA